MKLALYQPDIAQNAGAAIRLCACLGVPLEVIEPCGFPFGERTLRRTAMDYVEHVQLTRHADWEAFEARRAKAGERLLLLSTRADISYCDFSFKENDILLLGQESAGVPEHVHQTADARLLIPMQPGLRSLNVITAGAMVLGEALRQIRWQNNRQETE